MEHSFIFSASSYNTLVEPHDAFVLLDCVRAKAGLASSYDLYQYKVTDGDYSGFISSITDYSRSGVVYIDSGNYEAGRNLDSSWSRERHIESISELDKKYYYFTFDRYDHFKTVDCAIKDVSCSIDDLMRIGIAEEHIIPILHITGEIGLKTHSNLNKVIKEIVRKYDVKTIAIPERDIGDGLLNRLRFSGVLKRNIANISPRVSIHLLGTGNPLSMVLFQKMGIKSFDGLEWCRQSIDLHSGLLFHPQQYDFFKNDFMAVNQDVISILKNEKFSYSLKIALHNACFMRYLDVHLSSDEFDCEKMVKETFPEWLVKKISQSAFP